MQFPSSVKKQLTDQIKKRVGESEFADRLINIATQIEHDFQGDEQERLLALVSETIDRHLKIRENTQRAHAALKQLEADQNDLLKLFEMITIRPDSETLH